ncbi:MAG TPA: GNAT family N-acetyltransferase [Bryobacteraceae bacterium]|nr:GNAT family N-acetyltransferase [Bryobacteraceae bacterium]
MKERLKRLVYGLLGKEPDAVVVSFLTGDPELARRMAEEVRALLPDRRHFTVRIGNEPTASAGEVVLAAGTAVALAKQLRRAFGRYRIGMAPVLFDGDPQYRALRRAAFLLAPLKVLAYNARLDRHHLRPTTALASYLFLSGVPVDRIYLRPRLSARFESDELPKAGTHHGRPFRPGFRRVLVATPYVPYPLSHGGAVRMYNLLRDAAREFDLVLFAFTEGKPEELPPLLEFCSAIVLVPKREHREPRWSTIVPPETFEYDSPVIRQLLTEAVREFKPDLRQVEYTALAGLGGDILVEHDVTFDLQRQVYQTARTTSAWWNWWRWQRFEKRAVERFRKAVVMSAKDAAILGSARAVVIPNGVDLERFRPRAEVPGARLLFIGSFRHFPNIVAYRFFTEQVWPRVQECVPEASLVVVAGPDPLVYWQAAVGTLAPPEDPRIEIHGFVRDVAPLYVEANLVVVPTLVSAGTNLKVLEAMAMRRAVISTTCGCAGLGLQHGKSVWVADGPDAFAEGTVRLLDDHGLRDRIAAAARCVAEAEFGWARLGTLQRRLYRDLLGGDPPIRPARPEDVPELDRIQRLSPEAVLWEPLAYLGYECRVAESGGRIAGFIVFRKSGEVEAEVLSLIVDPALRRCGMGARLLEDAMRGSRAEWFLEVRESNWPARHLYRKYGFVEVSHRPKYYQDNGETAVVMRRRSC